jgi:ATP-binding cassette, subfamily A (ABC1), member 3
MMNSFVLANSFTLTYKSFSTIEEVETYVSDPGYDASYEKPELCFGIYFQQVDIKNYNYSIHTFDTTIRGGKQDTPNALIKSLDPFQVGPDMGSYDRWKNSNYLITMKVINDYILKQVTNNKNATINFGMMTQKYSEYKKDPFGGFLGGILPFFLIIAYLCPLCVMVFRMVQEKESRAKEGMKIMGLSETVYFFSYFLHWLILNSIYSIINSIILTRVFSNIGPIFILGFFWLFGMCIFALAYFFQSIMDKTRIAIIITILVYFIMYFVSAAVSTEDVDNLSKMFISLFPPTCLALGITTLAKYETSFRKFEGSNVNERFNNYSVSDMYLMLFIDFFVYLFLGYYLQNVLSHQFGIKRPFYFLCTKSFWCKKKKINSYEIESGLSEYVKVDIMRNHTKENENNFQSEQMYEERIKNGECLSIKGLKKIFDDGKVAVDGLNLNLYNEEIFALLGHNGAGKSTTISILCGLYEATGGTAIYKGMNILEEENMEIFRRKLGICPQHDVLFGNLTVKEHLYMFSIFKGVQKNKIEAEITQILHDVHMTEKKDELAKNLSGGQKRKLSIAIALIGGSEVVFLDEPSSGMDITSRRNLWEILKKLAGNRIIVLTTHYMEEAAVLGNRIGIVSNGKLKCCGNGLFLIDKFGKYLSLNVYKLPDAKDKEIIEFVKNKIPNVEYETLSEEILFRILKEDKNDLNEGKKAFSFKNFFYELDQNLQNLNIKSYSASMPTLEDVFLNVSADSKNKLIKNEESEPGSEIEYNRNNEEHVSSCKKFFIDFKCSLKKRFLQIIRDKKTFVLEILCPIILVLIGLGVSSVKFIKNSPQISMTFNLLPNGQTMVFNKNMFSGKPLPMTFQDTNNYNLTYSYDNFISTDNIKSTLINYNNYVFNLNNTNSYGNYYIVNMDQSTQKYEFVLFPNIQSRNSAIIYMQYMMNNIISYAASDTINISFAHRPFPLTDKSKKTGETRNSSNLVFFVSVAFALIPANFITVIIKERETNTKHLQIISGISLTSYWLSNFVFELVKYYFIGGVNLLIILGFDKFPNWFGLIYIVYGLAMTSFTYMFALFFKTESSAQNTVILVNFLFGALGGTIILILRLFEDLRSTGKKIAQILRIIPSFAFSYGFNQLLNAEVLFISDYPDSYYYMLLDPSTYIIKYEYAGADVEYMILEFIVYLLILIFFEFSRNRCSSKKPTANNDYQHINDTLVKDEIEKATNSVEDGKYSIRVKNLEKVYGTGLDCSKAHRAVNKLSFCLEFGECFALLGVNGAGKTTTFKSLTAEHLPTAGEIFINGMEIGSNFNKVRNMIGYCPQFDAIFDYMTVYENLDFYARIKGIPSDKVEGIINSLMKELNLAQYRNKVSGNLSGGNKRKLSVGIAMIGNPPIILLDEPSNGMDPEARRFMWAVIHKISTRSKMSSVILTTHSMEEAETLCRRMGIMVAGQFKCIGTSQYIKDKYGFGYEIDLRIQHMPDAMLNEILHNNNLNHQEKITSLSRINEILDKIDKSKFASQFDEVQLGREILEEVRKCYNFI